MAIDDAEKRRSVAGITIRTPGVTPNASTDQQWRQQAGYGYSGILAGSPAAGSPLAVFHNHYVSQGIV